MKHQLQYLQWNSGNHRQNMFCFAVIAAHQGGVPEKLVNREYFVVKIFSDRQACAKIERKKIHNMQY